MSQLELPILHEIRKPNNHNGDYDWVSLRRITDNSNNLGNKEARSWPYLIFEVQAIQNSVSLNHDSQLVGYEQNNVVMFKLA